MPMYPFVSRHKMALPHEELLRLQNELKREREKNAALQKEVRPGPQYAARKRSHSQGKCKIVEGL